MGNPSWTPRLLVLLRRLTTGHHETRDALEALQKRVELVEKATMPGDRLRSVYRGTWKAGRTYPAGSFVTRSGSLWHAGADTSERPGDGETAWRLAVKRGEGDKLDE